MPRDTAPTIDPALVARPHGRYTIELFDADTGELDAVHVADNYITPLYEQHVAGYQYLAPWLKGNLPASSTLLFSSVSVASTQNLFIAQAAARLWNPYTVPALPSDSLIITDDPTAEDTTETWLRGRVIAWANRFKRTVPASGSEGLINEAESELTNNGLTHKTVWDFTTQQGNGEFQTLAIGSVTSLVGNHTSRGEQAFWTAAGPRSIVLGDRLPYRGSTAPLPSTSNMWSDGTNLYWIGPDANSATANAIIYSTPVAAVFGAAAHATDPFVLDASGAGPTTVADTSVNYANGSTSVPSVQSSGRTAIARIGTTGDFLIAYCGTGAASYLVTVRRVTAAGSVIWTTNPIPSNTPNQIVTVGIVYDGTHAFVAAGATAGSTVAGNIYRINVSTGALDATIPIPGGIQVGTNLHGANLAWDGTNMILSADIGLVKISTAGALVAPFCYGLPFISAALGTAVAPWATTANKMKSINRRTTGVLPVTMRLPDSPTAVVTDIDQDAGPLGELNYVIRTSDPVAGNVVIAGYLVHDGKLWALANYLCHSDFKADPAGLIAITGANMFSRAVLDTPVTKNTSQNMKITYEITWPGHDLTTYPEHRDL